MNIIYIYFVVYLVHSSVVQALQCYTGNHLVGTYWHTSSESELEKHEAEQRTRLEKALPLIDCPNEFSQCFKLIYDCGIADSYYLTKGCAKPDGNRTCVLAIPTECQDWRKGMSSSQEWRKGMRSKCEMCSNGNGCNKEDWQNGNNKMVSSSTTTTTIGIVISTTNGNDIVTINEKTANNGLETDEFLAKHL